MSYFIIGSEQDEQENSVARDGSSNLRWYLPNYGVKRDSLTWSFSVSKAKGYYMIYTGLSNHTLSYLVIRLCACVHEAQQDNMLKGNGRCHLKILKFLLMHFYCAFPLNMFKTSLFDDSPSASKTSHRVQSISSWQPKLVDLPSKTQRFTLLVDSISFLIEYPSNKLSPLNPFLRTPLALSLIFSLL